MDNLPVGTALVLGTEVVFAVDVSASNAFRADVQEEGFASVFARATEIAMQSLLELRLHSWTTPPIYYVHPRVEHISMFSFDHLREVVEEGYRSTSAALDTPQEWPQPGDVGVYPKRGVVVRVQRERCIGCGACLLQAPPGMFVLDAQGKAVVTRPEQVATVGLLDDAPGLHEWSREFRRGIESRLTLLHRGLQALKALGLPVESVAPQGAIYLTARFHPFGRRTPEGQLLQTNEQVRRYLLETAAFAAVPFQAFGAIDEDGWFRLSVGAVGEADIEAALPRLQAALEVLA